MAIPEFQLQTWANQGATDAAESTHHSLKRALDVYKQWPAGVKFETYLQGSYLNTTNIRGDSDVDLVAELTSVQYSNLTEAESAQLGLTDATYNWGDFRRDVVSPLTEYYGTQYIDTSGKKSVKVLPNAGRLKADVVVATTYRYYENLRVRAEGIKFFMLPDWREIINYPKVHYHNGADKNSEQQTRGWYKQTIRTYKNARNRIVVNKPQFAGRFPSYFIECLLYNVSNSAFGGTYQENFRDTLNHLREELYNERCSKWVCQNGMYYLFGPLLVQWNITDAREFVSQLIDLWDHW